MLLALFVGYLLDGIGALVLFFFYLFLALYYLSFVCLEILFFLYFDLRFHGSKGNCFKLVAFSFLDNSILVFFKIIIVRIGIFISLIKIKFTDAIVAGNSVVIVSLVVFLFNFSFIEFDSLFIYDTFLNFGCAFFHIVKSLEKSQRILQFIFDSLHVLRRTFSSS